MIRTHCVVGTLMAAMVLLSAKVGHAEGLPGASPTCGGDSVCVSTQDKNVYHWTVRFGVGHDSYGHTAPGNPSATGPALQVQYNLTDHLFVQGTVIENVIQNWTTNFMVLAGWEVKI